MNAVYEAVAQMIEALTIELKHLGRWTHVALTPDRYVNIGPYGCRTMHFEQWLQFILIPKLRNTLHRQGSFEGRSEIGRYAAVELQTDPDSYRLIELLTELDALLNGEYVPTQTEADLNFDF